MPYIPLHRRTVEVEQNPATVGELNYALTMVAIRYLRENGVSYGRINEVIGAFECAKAEIWDRIARKYEEAKMRGNGDVYEGLTS